MLFRSPASAHRSRRKSSRHSILRHQACVLGRICTRFISRADLKNRRFLVPDARTASDLTNPTTHSLGTPSRSRNPVKPVGFRSWSPVSEILLLILFNQRLRGKALSDRRQCPSERRAPVVSLALAPATWKSVIQTGTRAESSGRPTLAD